MPDRFIQTNIRRLPLFQQMPDDQLAVMSDAFQIMRFQPGESVFRQGEEALGMYLFISGRAVLIQVGQDGIERQVGMVGENQYLNEGALFSPITETASLRIIEPAVVMALPRARLMATLNDHPELRPSLGLRASDQAAVVQQQEQAEFQGQRDNETTVLSTHRHWWAFARQAWLPVLLFVVMVAAAVLVQVALLTLALCGLAVVFPGLLTLYFYLEWRDDELIITDQRIIHHEHNLLTFSSTIDEIPLASISEVKAAVPTTDPFARLFHYGTVELKTAGRAGTIRFDLMPNPDDVQAVVFDHRSREQQRQAVQQRQTIRSEVDKLVSGGSIKPSPGAPKQTVTSTGGFSLARMKFTDANGATVYRKHYLIWLRHIFLPSGVVFVSLILFLLCLFSPTFRNLGTIGFLLAFFVFLVGVIWFYWADWDWRNDLYIVDDQTISLIHKRPLWLQNEKDQVILNRVDNVSSSIHGLFQNLFNFGDVRLSLLGAADQSGIKVFESVHNPREVQEEISRRQERARRLSQSAEDQRQQQIVAQYISAYHETQNPQAAPPANPPRPPDRNRPPRVPPVRGNNPPS